jgi:hypothetical protein
MMMSRIVIMGPFELVDARPAGVLAYSLRSR